MSNVYSQLICRASLSLGRVSEQRLIQQKQTILLIHIDYMGIAQKGFHLK